jgi:hypothetical protein
MSDPDNIMLNAGIKSDGSNREGIDLYSVRTADGLFWFEVEEEYAENDNDFWVTIRNFGLIDRASAGSTTPFVRRTFTASEARTARARLEALFMGPTDNPGLSGIYRQRQGKCLGLKFPPGWIRIES